MLFEFRRDRLGQQNELSRSVSSIGCHQVDVDCHISAALFYNPKTGYVRGIIRCNCCGQEKLLFVKYKAKANGMPEKGTGTFHWIK